ncbi:hypothetical protein CG017_03733 [Burkholderia glumae]|nr:hypothetical protein CG017_03733 [Burkholderia glumae]
MAVERPRDGRNALPRPDRSAGRAPRAFPAGEKVDHACDPVCPSVSAEMADRPMTKAGSDQPADRHAATGARSVPESAGTGGSDPGERGDAGNPLAQNGAALHPLAEQRADAGRRGADRRRDREPLAEADRWAKARDQSQGVRTSQTKDRRRLSPPASSVGASGRNVVTRHGLDDIDSKRTPIPARRHRPPVGPSIRSRSPRVPPSKPGRGGDNTASA